jgi:integrase
VPISRRGHLLSWSKPCAHTTASLAISAGANVKVVQRMLGHATAAMTLDLYGHLLDDDLSGVADALGKAIGSAAVSGAGTPEVGAYIRS